MDIALIQKRKKYAIFIFLSIVIPYILVYFHRVTPAVVSQQLMSYFKISGIELGNLSAVYFYFYTLMQIPAGILADSIGPRKVIFVGSLISGFGSILFGISEFYFLAFIGRFLVGLGVSVIFISILKLNQNWFDYRQFSLLSGITLFLGNFGALVATVSLTFFTNLWGWKNTFIVIGILGIVFGILSYFVICNHPKEKQLPPPEGASETSLSLSESLRGSLKVIQNPYTWYPFITFFGIYGTLMTFQGAWGIPFLIDVYNLDKLEASKYLMQISFGLMVGSPLQGYFVKRFSLKKFYFFNMLIFLIMFFIIENYKINLSKIYYIFFLIGFTGSSFILTWTLAKSIHPKELAGSATGIANMGGFLGAAVLQPLFGYLLDINWAGEIDQSIRNTLFLLINQLLLFFMFF